MSTVLGGRATAVAPSGGEIEHEAALAMQTNMLLARLAQTIYACSRRRCSSSEPMQDGLLDRHARQATSHGQHRGDGNRTGLALHQLDD